MKPFGLTIISGLIAVAGCTSPRYTSTPPQVISSPAYGVSSPVAPAATESDRALENQIRQSLANGNLSYLATHVSITAASGTVTLSGSVPNAQDREALDTLVRNTTGVNSVVDQIRVEPAVAETSPGNSAPIYSGSTGEQNNTTQMDRSLVDRIEQALRNNSSSSALADKVNVSALNGVVTLTGSIPGQQQRQWVDNIVRNTSGVKSVYDRMQIAASATGRVTPEVRTYSGASPAPQQQTLNNSGNLATGDIFNLHVQGLNDTDRSLAQQILQGLKTDATLSSTLPIVNINVSGGRVVLQGNVQTEQQKQAIGSVVERAAGGSNVENQLQVNSQQ